MMRQHGIGCCALAALLTFSLSAIGTAQTTVGLFTGGDAGEGLDLDGIFPYAVNVRAGNLAVGPVRDAFFLPDTIPNVQVISPTQTVR